MQVNMQLLRQQHAAIIAAVGDLHALTDQPYEQAFLHIANARLRLAKSLAEIWLPKRPKFTNRCSPTN